MDEEPEKKFPVSKEDVAPLLLGLICLALTLYLFFGPSPTELLFPKQPVPAPAAQEQAAPQPVQGMMPATEKPEQPKK